MKTGPRSQKLSLSVLVLTLGACIAMAGGKPSSISVTPVDSPGAKPAVAEQWRITAGPIKWLPGDEIQILGTFQVNGPVAQTDADTVTPQGGACLVVNLVPFGIGRPRCATNTDCNQPEDSIDKQKYPHLADSMGYCTRRDGSVEHPQCWTRPGPAGTHCKRTVDTLVLTDGEHSVGPVAADPLGTGEPYPEWAVYACMAQPGHPRACGEASSDHRQISVTPPTPERP